MLLFNSAMMRSRLLRRVVVTGEPSKRVEKADRRQNSRRYIDGCQLFLGEVHDSQPAKPI